MLRKVVAFVVLALAGPALFSVPASAAGGFRPMPGGGFRAPMIVQPQARAGLLAPRHGLMAPRAVYGAEPIRPFVPQVTGRSVLPPPARGYATTTPARPFSHLVRRHHRVYHAGWSFPVTTGADAGYIGQAYDPSELVRVYAPAPTADLAPSEPAFAAPAAAIPRVSNVRNADACSSERVTVPAGAGEREITVVRC